MQFENISMHCENRHIVESCEITDTVAPDEVLMVQNSIDTLCYYSIYLCFSRLKQSLSMVNVVVLSKFSFIFCVYSVIFCTKMVELRMFARTDIVWGNVYSSIYVD